MFPITVKEHRPYVLACFRITVLFLKSVTVRNRELRLKVLSTARTTHITIGLFDRLLLCEWHSPRMSRCGYSFLLCNSNFVFKTRRFYDIRLQKIP